MEKFKTLANDMKVVIMTLGEQIGYTNALRLLMQCGLSYESVDILDFNTTAKMMEEESKEENFFLTIEVGEVKKCPYNWATLKEKQK